MCNFLQLTLSSRHYERVTSLDKTNTLALSQSSTYHHVSTTETDHATGHTHVQIPNSVYICAWFQNCRVSFFIASL